MDVSARSTRVVSDSCPQVCSIKQVARGSLATLKKTTRCHNHTERRSRLLGGPFSTKFGAEVSAFVWRSNSKRRPTSSLSVSALFEKFTEQAIKGVVNSQREAKALGANEVKIAFCPWFIAFEACALNLPLDASRLSQNICFWACWQSVPVQVSLAANCPSKPPEGKCRRHLVLANPDSLLLHIGKILSSAQTQRSCLKMPVQYVFHC